MQDNPPKYGHFVSGGTKGKNKAKLNVKCFVILNIKCFKLDWQVSEFHTIKNNFIDRTAIQKYIAKIKK